MIPSVLSPTPVHALADCVNEIRQWRRSDSELIDAYGQLLTAFATLIRPRLEDDEGATRLAVIDHLLGRLAQARAREIDLSLADIADRLHAELVAVMECVPATN